MHTCFREGSVKLAVSSQEIHHFADLGSTHAEPECKNHQGFYCSQERLVHDGLWLCISKIYDGLSWFMIVYDGLWLSPETGEKNLWHFQDGN
jgi:hypothetical protein